MTQLDTRANRPRSNRYPGRKSREVLFSEEQDAWLEQQMQGKWSRNAVIEQALNVAMGKVDESVDQSDAVAATLLEMRADIDKLAHQLRTVLAILNHQTRLRYLQPDERPTSYAEHARQVNEIVQRMAGGQ
jgi:hypothetical protein